MDNDSFESFINQSLVDTNTTNDNVGLENEIFMQLLLSTVPPSALATTIDPSELTAEGGGNEFMADDNSQNALLAAALYSALDATTADDAMLVDAATITPAALTTTVVPPPPPPMAPVAKPKQTAPPAAAAAAVGGKEAATVASGLASPGNEFDDFDMAGEDMEGIDLKSLTSKERRQLRNKISARNFRVRRKEYITNLEAEVRMHKEEADGLRSELNVSRKDNALLRDEIKKLRLRLGVTAPAAVVPSSAAAAHVTLTRPAAGQLTAPALTRPASQAQPQPQTPVAAVPSQPAPPARFNPHKDLGQSAGAKKDGNWAAKNGRSGFIAVNTATVPADHNERLQSLVADAQSNRAVEALLNMGQETRVDPVAPATAALAVFAVVAEFVMSQFVLEASFALAHSKVSC
ncbi:hypothetical protein FBU31_005382 [Coemansia sp. 'formosensis']|nr:hypothetical protein FBU31_005382 [Coemansia sp. 'formosensis']